MLPPQTAVELIDRAEVWVTVRVVCFFLSHHPDSPLPLRQENSAHVRAIRGMQADSSDSDGRMFSKRRNGDLLPGERARGQVHSCLFCFV